MSITPKVRKDIINKQRPQKHWGALTGVKITTDESDGSAVKSLHIFTQYQNHYL